MPAVDVIVIGSGPTGLHAAIELKRLGLNPLIVERDPEPGGVPRWCHHRTYPCRVKRRLFTGSDYAQAWVREAQKASVEIMTETTVLRLDPARPAVHTTSPRGLAVLEARAVLLATGARESHRHARLVAGDRPRNVFTTASLFQCLQVTRNLSARRFVVFGSEDVSYSCAHALRSHGAAVAGVVESAPATRSSPLVRWYFERLRGVPHFFSIEDFTIHGKGIVDHVTFTRAGSPDAVTLECDGVVFTGGFIPNSELAWDAGIHLNAGARGPSIDQCFRTSSPWVFAAGNCLRGVVSGDEAALEGRMSARAIGAWLNGQTNPKQSSIDIALNAPLAYCCPDRLVVGQRGISQVAIWCGEHCRNVTVVAQQSERRLWRRRYGRIQPGRRIFVPLEKLALEGAAPLRFSLEG